MSSLIPTDTFIRWNPSATYRLTYSKRKCKNALSNGGVHEENGTRTKKKKKRFRRNTNDGKKLRIVRW